MKERNGKIEGKASYILCYYIFLEANKCLQRSGCKQSPQDLEQKPNPAFPMQIPLSSKVPGKQSTQSVLGRLEIRALFNKAECKRRYCREEKKLKGDSKAHKSTDGKLENAGTEDAHSKDLESLCENAL